MINRIFFLILFLAVIACSSKNESTAEETPEEYAGEIVESNLEDEENSITELYDQLYEALKAKDFTTAEAIIMDNKVALVEYEEMHTNTNCFWTHLWRFSHGGWGNDQSLEVVDFLLNQGFNPNVSSVIGCEEGFSIGFTYSSDYEITERLIAAGSEYAMDGWIYELTGLNSGKIMEGADNDMVVLSGYLDQGADPNLGVIIACGLHEAELYSKCVSLGFDIDRALRFAIHFEDMSIVRDLISKGAVIRNQSYFSASLGDIGFPPLMIAYSKNNELKELVSGLIEGSIFSMTDGMEGCDGSMLEAASREGNFAAVQFMLETGADPNAYCCDWGPCSSPLGAAQEGKYEEVVALLKSKGAKLPE